MYFSPPPLTNALTTQFINSIDPIINTLLPQNQKHSYQTTHLENANDPARLGKFQRFSSLNFPKFDSLPYLHYYHPSLNNLDFSKLSQISPLLLKSTLFLSRPSHDNENVASGLLLSYFYNSTEDEQRWNNTIDSILQQDQSTHNSKSDRLGQTSFFLSTSPKKSTFSFPGFVRSLPFSYFPYCPLPFVNLIVTSILLAVYVAISWDISTVQSKLGIFVAFLAQFALTLCSSFTIVSYFFPTFSHDSIRHFLIIIYFVAISSIENISRFLNAVARTPHENPYALRVQSGFSNSFNTNLNLVLRNVSILSLFCIPPFSLSAQSKHLCSFALVAILIDLVLHATYFTAVLSIDLRRFEIEDLASESCASLSRSSPYLTFLNAENNLPSFLRPFYIYIRHLYFHPKISGSTFILIGLLVFVQVWALVTDPSNLRFYSSGRFPFFFSGLTAYSKMFSKFSSVCLFEPIVIQGVKRPLLSNPSHLQFTVGLPIVGTFAQFVRILSVTVILELFASITFMLSLTGVILKYMLPPSTDKSKTLESSPVVEFFSKDLIGFHTLDVLQVFTQGTIIATVSLDHKICVWNASSTTAQNRVVKPTPIPFPTEFWPVTKVVLNSSANMIAIFSSKTAGIRTWDYKNNKLLYHIQDRKLFNASPVKTFFSGSDLVVVTRECLTLSISETGQSTQFPIEFPSKVAKVIHAERLTTPRIPERVICMSPQNEIIIGTHIGKTWRFRKLMIQESPIQFNLHTLQSQGMHDLSKYKPQPIPAPQAMMARSPMRMGRMVAARTETAVPPRRRPTILDGKVIALVPVPAINMVLIATSIHACLFDAQTGIIVKHFQTGNLKPASLKVFHSQPTHCRFCGCVSVDTLSIAYSDAEQSDLVICHTLTIDNRAKNSICIRVERDPRETRCLGFEATTERQHWIDRVEGWDTTDMNMIMGVRRKEQTPSAETTADSSLPLFSYISGLAATKISGSQAKSASLGTSSTVSRSSGTKSRSSKGFFVNKFTGIQSFDNFKSSSSELSLNQFGQLHSSKPNLNSTWEGWALSATGQVSYYDIPDFDTFGRRNNYDYANRNSSGLGANEKMINSKFSSPFTNTLGSSTIGAELDNVSFDRLLIRSIGPVTKYGAKSIVVAFGNVIKILYFGKEESHTPESSSSEAGDTPYSYSNLAKYNKASGTMFNDAGTKMAGSQGSRKWRREVGY